MPEEDVWEVDAAWGAAQALDMLAQELGASSAVTPMVNCRGVFNRLARPALPTGRLWIWTENRVCNGTPVPGRVCDLLWRAARYQPEQSERLLLGALCQK